MAKTQKEKRERNVNVDRAHWPPRWDRHQLRSASRLGKVSVKIKCCRLMAFRIRLNIWISVWSAEAFLIRLSPSLSVTLSLCVSLSLSVCLCMGELHKAKSQRQRRLCATTTTSRPIFICTIHIDTCIRPIKWLKLLRQSCHICQTVALNTRVTRQLQAKQKNRNRKRLESKS